MGVIAVLMFLLLVVLLINDFMGDGERPVIAAHTALALMALYLVFNLPM